MPITEYLKKQALETLKKGGDFSAPREIVGASGFFLASSNYRPKNEDMDELAKINFGNADFSIYTRLG